MSAVAGAGAAAAGMAMITSLGVHIYPQTPIRVRLHPEENRAVLIVGDVLGCPTTLDLYVQRAELVALRDMLTAAVLDLDTAQQVRTPRKAMGEPAA